MRDGIAVVLASPALVRIAGGHGHVELGISMMLAVGLLYFYRLLHLSPAVVGVLLAVVEPRLCRRAVRTAHRAPLRGRGAR